MSTSSGRDQVDHSNELHSTLIVAEDAARKAGAILLELMDTAIVREKGKNDLVTNADLAAQHAIREILSEAFPSHAWIGEEDTLHQRPEESQLCWVVDPLDGTANYAHRFPNFAVSIGLVQNSQILLGVVFDPSADEMFSAIRGCGATLNGTPIRNSGQTQLDRAMIAASFPPDVSRDSPAVEQFLNVLTRCQSVRRLGSAALNLCYVGCGRMDGYWTETVKPWDVAAGALISREAGSYLRSTDDDEFNVWDARLIVASSKSLFSEIKECLQV